MAVGEQVAGKEHLPDDIPAISMHWGREGIS